ncbi:MAG: tandem-95 repeat protein, partial [Sedimenticola sp.]
MSDESKSTPNESNASQEVEAEKRSEGVTDRETSGVDAAVLNEDGMKLNKAKEFGDVSASDAEVAGRTSDPDNLNKVKDFGDVTTSEAESFGLSGTEGDLNKVKDFGDVTALEVDSFGLPGTAGDLNKVKDFGDVTALEVDSFGLPGTEGDLNKVKDFGDVTALEVESFSLSGTEGGLNKVKDFGDVTALEVESLDLPGTEGDLNKVKDYGEVSIGEEDALSLQRDGEILNKVNDYQKIDIIESDDSHANDIRQSTQTILEAESVTEERRKRSSYHDLDVDEEEKSYHPKARDELAVFDTEGFEETAIRFTSTTVFKHLEELGVESSNILDISIESDRGHITDNSDGTYTFHSKVVIDRDNIPLIVTVVDGDTGSPVEAKVRIPVQNIVEEEIINAPVEISGSPEFLMEEDGEIIITADQLLANASDPENAVLIIEQLSADDGQLVDNGDDTWTFIPDENFHGDISLSYLVSDGFQAVEATGAIRVASINDAPIIDDVDEGVIAEGASTITGQLTSSDVDDNDTATFTISEGVDAPAGFIINDDGVYAFDPADAAYDHLNVGDATTLTIPVTVTDKYGATDTTQIKITVTGTNDAPVADAEVFSAQATEGGAIITGEVSSSDIDDNSTALFSIREGEEKPAGFELQEDGSYRFDPTHDAYEYLYAGEVQTITIPVTVTDDNGATDTTEIRITLTGTNDAPVAGAEVVREVAEGDVIITGKLTSDDLDHHDTATFSISENAEAPAGFELLEDGTYRFDPTHPDYDHLNVGDTEALSIPVTVTDAYGDTDTTQIRITITGTNDAPIAGAEVTREVAEGETTITGKLDSTDIDDHSTAIFSISEGIDGPAGFELLEDGSYSFDPSHEAYEYLNAGEIRIVTAPITITDDNGATDTTEIKITVTGTNDAPVAGAEVFREVAEGDVTITGKLTSDDLDHHATATFSISENAPPPAGFKLLEDGSYSFDPAREEYDHLNVGDIHILTIPVTVTDDNGATDTTEIKITVTGTNDAPVADAEVFSTQANEGGAVITGEVTSKDVDDGSTALFSISEGEDQPAGFELQENGSYRF